MLPQAEWPSATDHDLLRQLGRAIRVANDANCFAVSEAMDGADRGGRAVVFGVILGTGVGGGIVLSRRVHVLTGANAIGGEWGHNPLPWPDEEERAGTTPCYCGKHGCIETFALRTRLWPSNYRALDTGAAALPARKSSEAEARCGVNWRRFPALDHYEGRARPRAGYGHQHPRP